LDLCGNIPSFIFISDGTLHEVNVLAAVVLFWATAASGLSGLLLWSAGIVHAALGALFVSALVTVKR
jgi:hypothetical protein